MKNLKLMLLLAINVVVNAEDKSQGKVPDSTQGTSELNSWYCSSCFTKKNAFIAAGSLAVVALLYSLYKCNINTITTEEE